MFKQTASSYESNTKENVIIAEKTAIMLQSKYVPNTSVQYYQFLLLVSVYIAKIKKIYIKHGTVIKPWLLVLNGQSFLYCQEKWVSKSILRNISLSVFCCIVAF